MVPTHATFVCRYIPVGRCALGDDHGTPIDPHQVRHYARLLRDPAQETDPIIVQPAGDLFRITNGRHRLLAHALAGRPCILAVVVIPWSEQPDLSTCPYLAFLDGTAGSGAYGLDDGG